MREEPYYPELIHSYEVKEYRRAQIRAEICELLRDEFYTVTEIVIHLGGYKSRQGASKVLNQMVREGLLIRHQIKSLGGRGLVLWGITKFGACYYLREEEIERRIKYFDPSKVSLSTLEHKIEIQKAKILLKNQEFYVCRLKDHEFKKKEPDFLFTHHSFDNKYYAGEVELTIKTKKRYIEIFKNYYRDKCYLESSMNECLEQVFWITKTDSDATRLIKIFKFISENKCSEEICELHTVMTIHEFNEMILET